MYFYVIIDKILSRYATYIVFGAHFWLLFFEMHSNEHYIENEGFLLNSTGIGRLCKLRVLRKLAHL